MKNFVIYDKATGLIRATHCGASAEGFYTKEQDFIEVPYWDIDNKIVDLASKQLVEKLPTLEEIKGEQWQLIRKERNTREFGKLEYNGNLYDIDSVAQSRIQGAVQLVSLDNTQTLEWTLADNTSVTLNATDVIGLAVALANHVNNCHSIARELRARIENAQTAEAVQQIQWPV